MRGRLVKDSGLVPCEKNKICSLRKVVVGQKRKKAKGVVDRPGSSSWRCEDKELASSTLLHFARFNL